MRYLKHTESGLVVPVLHEDGHVANGHALADPENGESAPAAGWVEVTEADFINADRDARAEAKKILEGNQAARASAGAKLAALGLTHAERQSLGLP